MIVWIYVATANKCKPSTTASVVLLCVFSCICVFLHVCSFVCACLIREQAVNANRGYYSEMTPLFTTFLITKHPEKYIQLESRYINIISHIKRSSQKHFYPFCYICDPSNNFWNQECTLCFLTYFTLE